MFAVSKTYSAPLDYSDIIYNKAYNEYFNTKLESIQYNAAGTIKEFSREKLYQELDLESFSIRRYKKLSFLFKIIKTESLLYLFNLVPNNDRRQITRNLNNLPIFRVNHEYFKNTFLPPVVLEWNKLDCFIRNSSSY